MIGVIGVALSILVMLAGLYLLAKSKKDSLGNLYIFSSYSAIALGGLLFVGTIVGGVMMSCHHSKGHSSCYVKGSDSSCGQASSCSKENSCKSHHKSHKKHGSCYGSGSGHYGGHHGGQASCGHGGCSSSKHHGDKKCERKIRKYIHRDIDVDDDDDEKEIEVEVEVKETVY